MQVLLHYTYRANKKEPFGLLLRRLHEGLVEASLPVSYAFTFADAPVSGGVSAVDRAVKKYPQVAPLIQPGIALADFKTISGTDAGLPFDALLQLADGLPRSLPFHAASVRFNSPQFGASTTAQVTGILANDSWWINGRQRSLSASFVVEAGESPKSPKPEPPVELAAFLATLGRLTKTNHFPLRSADPAQRDESAHAALVEITRKFRAQLKDLVTEAGMPHTLPTRLEALTMPGGQPHPLKPTLERHFGPLGYSCKGGVGTFTLRRRTPANNVVEIALDVGTWSRSVTAHFNVHVPGHRCTFSMPVAPGLDGGQYPIGEADRWEKIVTNLAALAVLLHRRIVPEIDASTGSAPEWFDAPNL
jgi:hypothetical protein